MGRRRRRRGQRRAMSSPGQGGGLTLTRKVGQVIRIAGGITVRVKEIRRGSVRIGIKAPRSVKILRDELDTEEQ